MDHHSLRRQHQKQQHSQVAAGVGSATEQMLCAAVGQAMLQLPTNLTMAYVEASVHAPDVVRQEADPILFLQKCDMDAPTAALMMAVYCKYFINIAYISSK